MSETKAELVLRIKQLKTANENMKDKVETIKDHLTRFQVDSTDLYNKASKKRFDEGYQFCKKEVIDMLNHKIEMACKEKDAHVRVQNMLGSDNITSGLLFLQTMKVYLLEKMTK